MSRRTAPLALALSLGLVGCGGGIASQGATRSNTNGRAPAEQRCDLSPAGTAQFQPFHVEGSRVVVPVPGDAVVLEGTSAISLPCGAGWVISDVPDPFVSDASFYEEARRSFGPDCVAEGRDLRCPIEGGRVMLVRVMRAQRAAALVAAVGHEDELEALLAMARLDPSLPLDPVRASGLTQPAPEGLVAAPESSVQRLIYIDPQHGPSAPAVALWSYQRFSSFETQPPTPREIGAHAGMLAVRELGIVPRDVRPLSDELLVAEGERNGAPVRLLIGFFVQDAGVWFFVGSAPAAEADVWMQRYATHLDQTRVQ